MRPLPIRRTLIASLLLAAATAGAATISSTTAPAVIHIGDTLTVSAVVEPADGVVTPIYPERIGMFEVLDVARRDTLGAAHIEIHLTTFETGTDTVPALPIAIDAAGRVDSLFTSPYIVSVESLLPADSTAADTAQFKAEHGPLDLPQRFLWKTALGYMGVLLVLAAGLFWLVRRLNRPTEVLPTFETKAPARPAEIVAYEQLDRVAAQGYVARGLWKPHYSEIMDVIRSYIEARFHIEALDRTSWELLHDLEDSRLEEANRRRLAGMLEEADLVKFAKVTPEAEPADRFLERARGWVRDTTTTPVFGAPPAGMVDPAVAEQDGAAR